MTEFLEQEIRTLRSLFWSERDPDGRGFAPLADAYRRRGDSRQALELLEDGIGRHPGFTPGHVVAARLYMDLTFFAEAELAARTALELDFENVEALRSLAGALDGKGEVEEAEEVRGRLSVLEPMVPADAPAEESLEAEVGDASAAVPDEEEALDASAFGEADDGDRALREYVEPADEMEEVDVGLADLSLAPAEPGAVDEPVVDIADLAPDEAEAAHELEAKDEPVVDIADLAPDEPEAMDEAVVDIADLAPDESEAAHALEGLDEPVMAAADAVPAEPEAMDEAVVDIADLAPLEPEAVEEPVVDIADLAPLEPEAVDEPVVDIAELAPDELEAVHEPVVDIAELAPDEPEAVQEPVMDEAELAPDEPEVVDESLVGSVGADADDLAGFDDGEMGHQVGLVGDLMSEEAADAPLEELTEAPIHTRTIAELYVKQGATARAVEVYRSLIEANPGDAELVARLADLEVQVSGQGPLDPDVGAFITADEREEEVESLARDLAGSGDDVHDVDTPFAWTEDEAEEADSEAPPVSEYFSRMLGWTPTHGADAHDARDPS